MLCKSLLRSSHSDPTGSTIRYAFSHHHSVRSRVYPTTCHIRHIFGRSRGPARAIICLVQLSIGIVLLLIRVVFLPLPLPLPKPYPYYLYNAPKVAVYASPKGSILATTPSILVAEDSLESWVTYSIQQRSEASGLYLVLCHRVVEQ